MESTEPAFQYEPLTSPRNIRVLLLQPSRKSDAQIHVSFEELALPAGSKIDRQYEALSYTWGAPNGTRPIRCEGATILVTPNCEQALLHLRWKRKVRRLWIDALCINQASVDEKNTQVPMMGDIYRCASRTVMWLGLDQDPQLALALRRAARYGGAFDSVVNTLKGAMSHVDKIRGSVVYENAFDGTWNARLLSEEQSEDVATIIKNEWFHRIWTVQEFLLSTNSIFLMGKVECPSIALYTYYRMGRGTVSRADLEHYRMRNSLLTLAWNSHRDEGKPSTVFLSVVLRLAAMNQATNPRDKVYGMMAFLTSKWPDYKPPTVDYAQTISQVYEGFVRSLIDFTGSLWPLGLVTNSSDSDTGDLPSWVMDLRHRHKLAHTVRLAPTSAEYIEKVVSQKKPGQLIVRAKRVGKVSRTSARMPSRDDSALELASDEEMDTARTACLSEWTAFVTALDLQEDLTKSPYLCHISEEEKMNSYWWAGNHPPCADPYSRALSFFTEHLDYLRWKYEPEDYIRIDSDINESRKKYFLEKKKEYRERNGENSMTHDRDSQSYDMHTLFIMKDGHLGICVGGVETGDSIYRLDGSAFAFVLRRVEKNFAVVGKCDIYTMSDGDRDEAWKKSWSSKLLEDDPKVMEIILV